MTLTGRVRYAVAGSALLHGKLGLAYIMRSISGVKKSENQEEYE